MQVQLFDSYDDDNSSSLINNINLDPDDNFFNNLSLPICRYSTADELSADQPNSENFEMSLLHVNCRSLVAHFQSFLTLINSFNFKIPVIAVCETWTTVANENDFSIPGYNFIVKSRQDKKGGGVGIYVLNGLEYTVRHDLDFNVEQTLETLIIELVRYNTLIVCVYHPPNSDFQSFHSSFDNMLGLLNASKKKCFVAGDFNIDLLKSDSHSSSFINSVFSHAFLPTVTKPTRVTVNSATLIDNVLINCYDSKTVTPYIVYNDISDHLPVFVQMKSMKFELKNSKFITKRKYNSSSESAFLKCLQNTNWDIVLDSGDDYDVNTLYTKFIQYFQEKFNYFFPLSKIKTNKRMNPRKPWITRGLVKSCATKEKLYKRFIKHPTPLNNSKYKEYRNILNKVLNKAQSFYYSEKFAKHKSDTRQTWNLIKSILAKKQMNDISPFFNLDDSLTSDKNAIAKKFNEYFTNIGPNLANKIPTTDTEFVSYLKGDFKHSFFATPTTPNEIISVVNPMLSKSSYGIDEIPLKTMKLVINQIALPLSKIINCSFTTGIFPNLLKIAKICPVYKSGPKQLISNYRPISILPSFSKIIEKVMHCRLMHYLSKNNILNNNQFGFRPQHSTLMAITQMIERITTALDSGQVAIGVFIDLSKAFDTLDHQILLHKLEFYGIRGILLNWFRSYLENRTQYVTYSDVNSTFERIVCGVPQGSILGPLLFLIYINDINDSTKLLNLILFADDTNIFYANKNLEVLKKTVNDELALLNIWFLANKLSLNVIKTNFIIFRPWQKRINLDKFDIVLNGQKINRVTNSKFLGVIIDEHLSWDKHIEQIGSKISKNIGIISKLKNTLPERILLMLYNTLVLPYINYCPMIWAHENNCTKINSIYKLQKRAVRIICKKGYREHAAPYFKKLNLLTINDVSRNQLLQFVFKSRHKLIPKAFQNLFITNDKVHCYNTRQANNYHLHTVHTNLRKQSPGFRGAKLWNELPDDIKESTTLPEFKHKVKSLFVDTYC